MNRTRLLLLAVASAAALLVLALAASSGPVRVWSVPSSDDSTVVTAFPEIATAPPTTIAAPVGRDDARLPTNNVVIQVLAVLIAILVLVALVVAFRMLHDVDLPRFWGRARRRVMRVAALPEFAAPAITVDAVAARAALLEGDPRNAIVACWMQLERDAAAAGLPRLAAETSQEYVERVVAAASVDRAPIGELATLYREARFSRHELRPDHRARAAAALERVVSALDTRVDA